MEENSKQSQPQKKRTGITIQDKTVFQQEATLLVLCQYKNIKG